MMDAISSKLVRRNIGAGLVHPDFTAVKREKTAAPTALPTPCDIVAASLETSEFSCRVCGMHLSVEDGWLVCRNKGWKHMGKNKGMKKKNCRAWGDKVDHEGNKIEEVKR